MDDLHQDALRDLHVKVARPDGRPASRAPGDRPPHRRSDASARRRPVTLTLSSRAGPSRSTPNRSVQPVACPRAPAAEDPHSSMLASSPVSSATVDERRRANEHAPAPASKDPDQAQLERSRDAAAAQVDDRLIADTPGVPRRSRRRSIRSVPSRPTAVVRRSSSKTSARSLPRSFARYSARSASCRRLSGTWCGVGGSRGPDAHCADEFLRADPEGLPAGLGDALAQRNRLMLIGQVFRDDQRTHRLRDERGCPKDG